MGNAVKTQIWIAVTAYLLVAILYKTLKLGGTFHRTLQVLSVHPFEKVPISVILATERPRRGTHFSYNQLELW